MVTFTEGTLKERILWKFEQEFEDEIIEREKYKEICAYNVYYRCIHVHLPTFGNECNEDTAKKCPYRTTEARKDNFRKSLLYGSLG